MAIIEHSSVIKAPASRLFEFFLDPHNLTQIMPPGVKVNEVDAIVPLRLGSVFSLRGRNGWLRFQWYGHIVEFDPPHVIVDEQLKGPFRSFRHTHRFRSIDDQYTLTIDRVEYEPPLGILGKVANACFIRSRLRRMFRYRHQELKELFESRPPAETPPR